MRQSSFHYGSLLLSYLKSLGLALIVFLVTGSGLALVEWAAEAEVTSFLEGWRSDAVGMSASVRGGLYCAVAASAFLSSSKEWKRGRSHRG